MKVLFVTLALLVTTSTFAQNKTNSSTLSNTSFFAELGGPGILFSANIDKRFKKQSALGFGGRIGLGFVSGYDITYNPNGGYYDNRKSVVTIPLQLNYLFGKPNSTSAFEVGAGITVAGRKLNIFDDYNSEGTSVYGNASFMYRRMPKEGGFSWRVGFTPIISRGYIQPLGAVSIGYNF